MSDLVYKKPKLYVGGSLKGSWVATLKIDGVRALLNPEWSEGNSEPKYVSRKNKPLHNLDHLTFKDAEIFSKNWETSVSLVRTHDSDLVDNSFVYELNEMDSRLYLKDLENPTEDVIRGLLSEVVSLGFEGLVLRKGDDWLKVKPKETYDVPIIGFQEGKGRNLGRMGALLTPKGKIGTGFTDKHREYFQLLEDAGELIGITIEVDCMGLTKDGKFRHGRFIHERFDKDCLDE